MHVQPHACFEHHALAAEFVELRLEGYIAQGLFDEASAHGLETFTELPWYTAYDFLPVIGEDAQRGYYACCGHAAQETVLLYKGCAGAGAGRRYGGDEAGGTSAAHNYVVAAGNGDIFPEGKLCGHLSYKSKK